MLTMRVLTHVAVLLLMTSQVRADNVTETVTETAEFENATTAPPGIPPRITSQPRSQFLSIDQTVTLDCDASGTPQPTYSWLKNGEPFDTDVDRIVLATPLMGSMTIEDAQAEDDGYYQCLAENQHGTALSETAYLQRAIISTASTKLKDYKATEGKSLRIKCRSLASAPPAVPTWKTGEELSTDKEALQLSDRVAVDDDGNLYFTHVVPADAIDGKIYTRQDYNPVLDLSVGHCHSRIAVTSKSDAPDVAPKLMFKSGAGDGDEDEDEDENGDGDEDEHENGDDDTEEVADNEDTGETEEEADNKDTEEVEEDADYEDLPDEKSTVSVAAGKRATLTCIFSGKPDVTVAWTREDDATFSATGTRLVIDDVTEDAEDDYTCTGSNSVGSASAVIELEVPSAPNFEKEGDKPIDKTAQEGDDVTFNCETEASPDADVLWYVNGQQVSDGGKYKIEDDGEELILKDLCDQCGENSGGMLVVQCNASNIHGSVMATAHLTVTAGSGGLQDTMPGLGLVLALAFAMVAAAMS